MVSEKTGTIFERLIPETPDARKTAQMKFNLLKLNYKFVLHNRDPNLSRATTCGCSGQSCPFVASKFPKKLLRPPASAPREDQA